MSGGGGDLMVVEEECLGNLILWKEVLVYDDGTNSRLLVGR